MMRKAKIIATMGPACQDRATIENLVRSGMNVARLNFSHGTHETHAAIIADLRDVSRKFDHPLAIMQDLQGPRARVGILDHPIVLEPGKSIILYPDNRSGPNTEGIPIDFPPLFLEAKPGNRILMDDGRIVVRIVENKDDYLIAEVVIGGVLKSNKGLNFPGLTLNTPAFTEKDAQDLDFGISHGVDFVALSFVLDQQDIIKIKERIQNHPKNSKPLIIAKLERPEALDNLEGILDVSDGVMVARGDLGVEMAPELVPGVQKLIIQQANNKGRIVITATQMLESMIQQPLPTRAEASDVANAVYDGTDALMLSGETAMGINPVESVRMMDRIICQAESSYDKWGHVYKMGAEDGDDAVAICLAARELAHDRDVEAISVFTHTGRTALLMAKTRPGVPIHAFTPNEEVVRRLSLGWGVFPHLIPYEDSVEGMIIQVEKVLKEKGPLKPGGQVVFVFGFPMGTTSLPNMTMLHTIR